MNNNDKIIFMNTKLYLYDLKRKKLENEIDETKKIIDYIDTEIDDLYRHQRKNFKIFLVTVIAEIIYAIITSSVKYSLPFPNLPFIIGTFIGSSSFVKHTEDKKDINDYADEKNYQNRLLVRLKDEKRAVENLKAKTKDLLSDESNKNRLDQIIEILKESEYYLKDIETEEEERQKTRTLKLEN